MKTHESSSHWRVVIYDYIDPEPSKNLKTRTVIGTQITGISLSRRKGTPDHSCTINVRGVPPSFYTIGNWVVVYTKKTTFSKDTSDGTPLFLGQILSINTSIQTSDSGARIQTSSVVVRSWSSLLRTPIVYDIFHIAQEFNKSSLSMFSYVQSTIENSDNAYSKMVKVTEDIYNPWRYAALVFAFVGALSEQTKSKVIDEMKKSGIITSDSETIANDYAEIATKLPYIPADLLKDLGFSNDVTPENAMFADDGFLNLLLGVQKNDKKTVLKNGIFESEEQMKNLYTPTADRPILSSVGPEFADSMQMWQLLQQRTDVNNSTENFVDFFYIKKDNKIHPRPVYVLRDKPYILKYVRDGIELNTAWTNYDSVPIIDLPAEAITQINVNNTFQNSPNYITCKFSSDLYQADSVVNHNIYRYSRVRLGDSINRFGGMTHVYNTPYTAINAQTQDLHTDWYKDLAAVQLFWHSYDFKFWHGSLNLLDPSIPISLGMNIRFRLGNFVCVAQVEAVSYSHMIYDNGIKRTTSSVQFSHLVIEMPAGHYEHPNTQFHAQVFDSQFVEENLKGAAPTVKPQDFEKVPSIKNNFWRSVRKKLDKISNILWSK